MYSKYHANKESEEMDKDVVNDKMTSDSGCPPINSLDELIMEIKRIFEKDDVDIDYVKYVLNSYKSNPKDWKRFAIFDQHRLVTKLTSAIKPGLHVGRCASR